MLDEMHRHPHARRTQRIYNGIDRSHYAPAPLPPKTQGDNALVVAFAGRLIAGKGADRAIEAVAQIDPRLRIKLLIAGEGPTRSQLEGLADSFGLKHAVHFLGQLNDMPAFWQAADVAVVPSESFIESFSMTTLESMACAKPVVATRNGAMPELVVDNVTGTLVSPGDVSALARALATYAHHPELRIAHGSAARARAVEHFRADDSAKAYLALFDSLIEAAPQPRCGRSH